ncbi:MAG: replicative DNA helicase [Thermoplasmata archaeon]|nr:replicative DNA helicase [Thermoplasmata archaeon]
MNLSEIIPPQALDVERIILGSSISDQFSASIVIGSLSENDFYSSANRKIFACMVELYNKNVPVDVVTISNDLKKKGIFESVGEEGYLYELLENLTVSGNIEHYTKILIEKASLRSLLTMSHETINDCFSEELTALDIVSKIETKNSDIIKNKTTNKVEKVSLLLPKAFESIDNYAKKVFSGVPTGFYQLDEITNGLQNTDLIIVAGRPSMGKTAFALSASLNAALKYEKKVLIFSLEMSKEQLMQRLLCGEARVNMHLLRRGLLPKRDYPKLSLAAGPLSESGIFIDDTPGIAISELRAKSKLQKSMFGLDLIIVDYLQLMGSVTNNENRQQEISAISRSLKGVAKELYVPMVALSQLSRAPEQRTGNHRPQLSDLRESGAIEQDADVVMFVYRDEVYNKDDEGVKGVAEIIVSKQRNGPLGTTKMAFIKEYARFENMPEENIETPQW